MFASKTGQNRQTIDPRSNKNYAVETELNVGCRVICNARRAAPRASVCQFYRAKPVASRVPHGNLSLRTSRGETGTSLCLRRYRRTPTIWNVRKLKNAEIRTARRGVQSTSQIEILSSRVGFRLWRRDVISFGNSVNKFRLRRTRVPLIFPDIFRRTQQSIIREIPETRYVYTR